MPSMGIDENNRVAGTLLINVPGSVENRAWTYDPANGYLLSPEAYTSIKAVGPKGTLAGEFAGTPTVFDWLGNPMLVFPNLAGSFMTANRYGDVAGYFYDWSTNWEQTAVVYTHDGQWIPLVSPLYSQSAVYGSNDNGTLVGYATDLGGNVWPTVWASQATFLPGPVGNYTIAVSISNSNQITGYTVDPTDRLLPIVWQLTPGKATYTVLTIPMGFSGGCAAAVNSKGEVVGTMWPNGDSEYIGRAFIWTAGRGLVDLNDLKAPSARVFTLVSANAINEYGSIAGIADVNGERRAYIATPNRPVRAPGVTGW